MQNRVRAAGGLSGEEMSVLPIVGTMKTRARRRNPHG